MAVHGSSKSTAYHKQRSEKVQKKMRLICLQKNQPQIPFSFNLWDIFFGETQVGTFTKLHFSCRGATKWVKKRFNSQASSSFSKASSNASITCSDGSSRSGQEEFNTENHKGKENHLFRSIRFSQVGFREGTAI